MSRRFLRISSRLMKHGAVKMVDKAAVLFKKRNLEGTNESSSSSGINNNSFAALANHELMLRASDMGIHFPNNDFTAISIVKELKLARSQLALKQSSLTQNTDSLHVVTQNGSHTPLLLDWIPPDEESQEEPNFILIQFKKQKKKTKVKVDVVRTRPTTRSQQKPNMGPGSYPEPPGRAIRQRKENPKFK